MAGAPFGRRVLGGALMIDWIMDWYWLAVLIGGLALLWLKIGP
jgi:hypothetical protein